MHYLACVWFTSGFSDSNHQTRRKTVDNIFIHNNRDYVAQKCTAVLQNYWHKIIYLRFHEELGHIVGLARKPFATKVDLEERSGFSKLYFSSSCWYYQQGTVPGPVKNPIWCKGKKHLEIMGLTKVFTQSTSVRKYNFRIKFSFLIKWYVIWSIYWVF